MQAVQGDSTWYTVVDTFVFYVCANKHFFF